MSNDYTPKQLLVDDLLDEIKRLRVEGERLRRLAAGWKSDAAREALNAADARAVCDHYRAALEIADTRATMYADERDRLHAALERIVNRTQLTSGSAATDACEIARAALAGSAEPQCSPTLTICPRCHNNPVGRADCKMWGGSVPASEPREAADNEPR
jgi:hypothetical protein